MFSSIQETGEGLEAETYILGRIRHSNIVKLLCCISSEDSKLLVYEYMENGSLYRWIHGKARGGSDSDSGWARIGRLDWPTLFQIPIGAAQGFATSDGLPFTVLWRNSTTETGLACKYRKSASEFNISTSVLRNHRIADDRPVGIRLESVRDSVLLVGFRTISCREIGSSSMRIHSRACFFNIEAFFRRRGRFCLPSVLAGGSCAMFMDRRRSGGGRLCRRRSFRWVGDRRKAFSRQI
ncbi:hypothetical protein MRB53_008553 [Persea americana]|uniref:Uncharacterized protein n=1 Tax=Persea americana TaxID=3435 RepID=A0ACC2MN39_PERAE|nr:hypothetical protein MRB53_008553 [Persea americana]